MNDQAATAWHTPVEAGGDGDPIERIDAWLCSIDTGIPISFGDYVITSREYVAVRMTTRDGIISDAVGLARKAPVDLIVTELLGPLIIGQDTESPDALMSTIRRATRTLGCEGLLARAIALVELCLWDSYAQRQSVPLWQLLGGSPRVLPVQVVEGYALPDESAPAFAERIAERAAQGFVAIKLELASESDPRLAAEKLRLTRSLVGDGIDLVVDMAYLWQSVEEAVSVAEQWADQNLAWLEDPMPRDCPAAIAELRRRLPMPIGAGDESSRVEELASLLDHDAVDVLRIDATTLGDLRGLAGLAESATSRGVAVASHVHPEIHRHVALAWPGLDRVEAFPLDRPFDRTHELLDEPMMDEVVRGHVAARTRPGIGINFDMKAIERTRRRATRIAARSVFGASDSERPA